MCAANAAKEEMPLDLRLEFKERDKPVELWTSATGMGDTVCGAYAACGLAETGRSVHFSAHGCAWLSRISHPGVTFFPHKARGFDINVNYAQQLAKGQDRKQWYCDAIASELRVDRFAPVAPRDKDRRIREARHAGKYTVLAPFAAHATRNWPALHWRRLAELLHREGYGVNVLCTSGQEPRLKETFGNLPGWVHLTWGASQDHVLDLLLGATWVIGCDSGIPHLAALMEVPTVAIHSHLPATVLWSHTGVLAMTPRAKCVFCRWQFARGYTTTCELACAAMAAVTPDDVMTRISEMSAPATSLRFISRAREG